MVSDDTKRYMWVFDVNDKVFVPMGELGVFSITQLESDTLVCIMPPDGKKQEYHFDIAAKDIVVRLCGNYDYSEGEENTVLSDIILGRLSNNENHTKSTIR